MPILNIAELAAKDDNSDEAGFIWELGEVSHQPDKNDRTKVVLGNGPHVKVTDVVKFESQFPGVILASLNGTSIKVSCQGVTRRALLKNRKAPEGDMRLSVIESLRGIKQRGGVIIRDRKILMVGDREFTDRDLAREYGRELLIARGLPEDMVENVLDALIIEVEVEA